MLERIVRELHAHGGLPHADPSRYFCAFNNRANINLVLFDRRSEQRLLFVKLSDLRDLESVYAKMKRVESLVEDALPEPVCSFRVGAYRVLATRAYRLDLLAARPSLGRREQLRVLDQVIDKLVELQRRTIDGSILIDRSYCEGVLEPQAREFFEQWSDAELEGRFAAHLESIWRDGAIRVPRIPQHGDLGAFNTALVDGDPDRVFIIDWDSYGDADLPGLDAVTFLTSFAKLYGEGVYGVSPLGRRLAAAAARYCEGVGMDPAALAPLYPVCWLQYAAVKLDIGVQAGQRVAYREIKRFLKNRDRFVLA